MFELDENNNIIIKNPLVLKIKQFEAIWIKDKAKNKATAIKTFAYIYFKNDFKSPYRNGYSIEELPARLREDLNLPKTWKVTKAIEEAEAKYVELQTTKSLKVLLAAESALEQITKYFNEFSTSKITDEIKRADAITKLQNNMKNLDEVVGRLEAAKNRVAQELQTKKLSGTKKLTSRELPKDKRKHV